MGDARSCWVANACWGSCISTSPETEGDGEREIIPEAVLGFPRDLKTVSKVFSIFFMERARISCFLGLKWLKDMDACRYRPTHLVERLPRFDSSKTHSWLPV